MKGEVNPAVCRRLNFSGAPRRRELYVIQQMVIMKAHTLCLRSRNLERRIRKQAELQREVSSVCYWCVAPVRSPKSSTIDLHLFFFMGICLFLNAALAVWSKLVLVGEAWHVEGRPVRQNGQGLYKIQCYTYAFAADLWLYLHFLFREMEKKGGWQIKVQFALIVVWQLWDFALECCLKLLSLTC